MKLRFLHFSVALALLLAACHATIRSLAPAERNRQIEARVGDPIEITLQTVGPGAFASPPDISASVVRFVDVTQVMPPVPAGPTQRFRFVAEARGIAIVSFSNEELARALGQRVMVQDTIIVR